MWTNYPEQFISGAVLVNVTDPRMMLETDAGSDELQGDQRVDVMEGGSSHDEPCPCVFMALCAGEGRWRVVVRVWPI